MEQNTGSVMGNESEDSDDFPLAQFKVTVVFWEIK